MISIVDDDSLVREAIGDLVNSLGYQSLVFASAEEFLQSGQVEDTACVITDLQMPGLSGLDLQERLLDGGFHTPVIFVTAHPKDKARERALNAGAIAFLSKPFEEISLISAVKSALNGS
jgi:FixJ family two-component response regulator